MNCTDQCRLQVQRGIEAMQAWKSRWPNHCITCMGSGVLRFYENLAPHGAGSWMTSVEEDCETCFGNCPRCGKSIVEGLTDDAVVVRYESRSPCEYCGWNWDQDPDDSCPGAPECICLDEQIEKLLSSKDAPVPRVYQDVWDEFEIFEEQEEE